MTIQASTLTLTVQLGSNGQMGHIPLSFDPRQIFGKARAPVWVELNGYRYRSTISVMGGQCFIPLRRSHREAAGLRGDETLQVSITLDTEPREVSLPEDLAAALAAQPGLAADWQALSYTHQREHVEAIESARRPETRRRRIAQALELLAKRPPLRG